MLRLFDPSATVAHELRLGATLTFTGVRLIDQTRRGERLL